ncbi:MAG: type II toxin-antitoxin system VapC family toxin [Acidobacteriota bacterium]|nr:type II toxin-antitoxin system VapC family toxin [Acidobacteriota bacterium]
MSRTALRTLDEAEQIGISVISCWEVALLVAKGRLDLDRDVLLWVTQALEIPKVRLLDLSPAVAVASTRLEWIHDDPADRIIVATAMTHRAPLVSKDRRIRSFRPVKAIW